MPVQTTQCGAVYWKCSPCSSGGEQGGDLGFTVVYCSYNVWLLAAANLYGSVLD